MAEQYDYIIVGGGAAGCVLANRLSAKSACSVLLLEAGRDTPPGAEPADVLSVAPLSYFNNDYKWRLDAHMRTRDSSAKARIQQGRILGGGSSVMGMVALRGTPDDYDEWQAMGAAGWGWNDVLPFFRRLETDTDFQNDMHGNGGPTRIRRHTPEQWPPLSRAGRDYAEKRQMPIVADMNGDFRDGYCALPIAATEESRQSSAICYLDATVRARPNLRIETGATVTGLLIEDRRCIGVTFEQNGAVRTIHASEVILSAGALYTPAILMRAGIGPVSHLGERGITVVADVPGVGHNLQNHPVLYFCTLLRPGAEQPRSLRSQNNTCFRYSSNLPDCPRTDMYTAVFSKTGWHALGQKLATLTTVILRPASRGTITLASTEPNAAPLIEFNFVSDERDMQRMIRGVRELAEFTASEDIAPLCRRVFPVFLNDRLRKLNQPSRTNAFKAQFVASLLDVAPFLSDTISRLIGGEGELAALAADSEKLKAHIRANIAGTAHYAGTCRMGAADDPGAVVDPQGRVRGVQGLRVADASVMPVITRGNTNIPTLMIGEKMADAIAADR